MVRRPRARPHGRAPRAATLGARRDRTPAGPHAVPGGDGPRHHGARGRAGRSGDHAAGGRPVVGLRCSTPTRRTSVWSGVRAASAAFSPHSSTSTGPRSSWASPRSASVASPRARVVVTPERETFRVRERARGASRARGGQPGPARGREVALAAVDALLGRAQPRLGSAARHGPPRPRPLHGDGAATRRRQATPGSRPCPGRRRRGGPAHARAVRRAAARESRVVLDERGEAFVGSR